MNEEMISRVIQYLEPMQIYVTLMRTYYQREDMDDFDKAYVDFFTAFEDLVYDHLHDPYSPLTILMNHYQELMVDYSDSILCGCLEALKTGVQKHYYYQEGKKDVYLKFLKEVHQFDASELFNQWDEQQFEIFERNVFHDLDVETLKRPSQ